MSSRYREKQHQVLKPEDVLTFGKYVGKNLRYIYKHDPEYFMELVVQDDCFIPDSTIEALIGKKELESEAQYMEDEDPYEERNNRDEDEEDEEEGIYESIFEDDFQTAVISIEIFNLISERYSLFKPTLLTIMPSFKYEDIDQLVHTLRRKRTDEAYKKAVHIIILFFLIKLVPVIDTYSRGLSIDINDCFQMLYESCWEYMMSEKEQRYKENHFAIFKEFSTNYENDESIFRYQYDFMHDWNPFKKRLVKVMNETMLCSTSSPLLSQSYDEKLYRCFNEQMIDLAAANIDTQSIAGIEENKKALLSVIPTEMYSDVIDTISSNGEDYEMAIDEFYYSPYVRFATNFIRYKIKNAISELPDREGEVINLRFGFDDGREKTYDEIGRRIWPTLSGSRIGQIYQKAIRHINWRYIGVRDLYNMADEQLIYMDNSNIKPFQWI